MFCRLASPPHRTWTGSWPAWRRRRLAPASPRHGHVADEFRVRLPFSVSLLLDHLAAAVVEPPRPGGLPGHAAGRHSGMSKLRATSNQNPPASRSCNSRMAVTPASIHVTRPSPNGDAADRSASNFGDAGWRMRPQACAASDSGMVSSPPARPVGLVMLRDRRPEAPGACNTRPPWCARRAPSAPPRRRRVPAVSTMSSTGTQVLPCDVADDVHHRRRWPTGRRLSMIARSASSRRLRWLTGAHVPTPPTSGDTTIRFRPCCRQMSASSSTGTVRCRSGCRRSPGSGRRAGPRQHPVDAVHRGASSPRP